MQNLDCFETILNGYLREKSLAGHGDEIHVFPLSFFRILFFYQWKS